LGDSGAESKFNNKPVDKNEQSQESDDSHCSECHLSGLPSVADGLFVQHCLLRPFAQADTVPQKE
jgi:hypothetical protein